MSRFLIHSLGATAVALALGLPAQAMHDMAAFQWGDVPPGLPKGAKIAVLHGDPGKTGHYVLRLSAPAGYKVLPHSHSQDENVTVISGTLMLGMGDKFDAKVGETMKAGAFYSIPAMKNHYAMAQTAVEIQIHGVGPFDINYVDPKDDPRKAMPK